MPATFFVLGSKLDDPACLRLACLAHAAGHWIGNHTFSHRVPLGRLADPDEARAEVLQAQARIGELAHPDRLFRPFGGGGAIGPHLLHRAALDVLEKDQMTCVLWNAVPRDWEDPDGWVETALAQCRAQPWSVVVLHDVPGGAMDHLEPFIEAVKAEGGVFRQAFPEDCLLLRRGRALRPLEAYVSG